MVCVPSMSCTGWRDERGRVGKEGRRNIANKEAPLLNMALVLKSCNMYVCDSMLIGVVLVL